MKPIDVDRVAPTPWRNGGGTTRELLALPAGDGWQLRLSVADIDRDGPFSAFPGVTRWFAVIDGPGVLLGLPTGARTVTPADAPIAFGGDHAPTCRLLGGPVRALNLMLRGVDGAMSRPSPSAGGAFGWPWRAALETGAGASAADGSPRTGSTRLWIDLPQGPMPVALLGPRVTWVGAAIGGAGMRPGR